MLDAEVEPNDPIEVSSFTLLILVLLLMLLSVILQQLAVVDRSELFTSQLDFICPGSCVERTSCWPMLLVFVVRPSLLLKIIFVAAKFIDLDGQDKISSKEFGLGRLVSSPPETNGSNDALFRAHELPCLSAGI